LDSRWFKQGFEGLFVCGPIEQAQHAKDGQLGTLAKPGLVRFHYFPGMGSLPYILSKSACHFGATTNVAVICIAQITA
jgi:hypothetical protein